MWRNERRIMITLGRICFRQAACESSLIPDIFNLPVTKLVQEYIYVIHGQYVLQLPA
jgi:hypothetical protein